MAAFRVWLLAGSAGLAIAAATPVFAAEVELTGVEVIAHPDAYDAHATATATRTDTRSATCPRR